MVNNNSTSNKKNLKPKIKPIKDADTPSRFKRLIKHPLIVSFLILIAFFVYLTVIAYWPKPLVSGFNYLGRSYNSGCLFVPFFPSFFCMGIPSDVLYFGTDIDPDKIADKFPDWEVENLRSYPYNKNAYDINLRNYHTGLRTIVYVRASNDKNLDAPFWILQTNKKYTITVSHYGYDLLIRSDH